MNLAMLLARAGRVHGSKGAIAIGARTVASYREFANAASSIAQGLVAYRGLPRGARVALLMNNCAEFPHALFACWWAGLTVVPINAKLHAREVAHILVDSGASLVVTTPGLESVATEASAGLPVLVTGSGEWITLLRHESAPVVSCSRDDPAWLFYTSGTTGRPKGATLSHANLFAMCGAFASDVDSVALGDGLLHAAPMSHGSGLYILPYVAGFGQQVIPESGGFEPDEIFALLRQHSQLSFFAAPTMVGRLVRSRSAQSVDTAHLKTIVYGGGPMYVSDTLAALDVFGPKLVQIYGQGETPMTITVLPKRMHAERTHPRFSERLASVGYAQGVVEVIVADQRGQPLAPGEAGEILVRGATVMQGYWNDPGATAATLNDGWLATGDIGTFDEAGLLTLKDRSKDVIISGGSNIYPREIEEVLLHHPHVVEAAVIGVPHADWGEEVVAFVVTSAEVSRDELEQLCLDNIARFKRPKTFHFVDQLPKNSYGKVLKTALRSWLSGHDD